MLFRSEEDAPHSVRTSSQEMEEVLGCAVLWASSMEDLPGEPTSRRLEMTSLCALDCLRSWEAVRSAKTTLQALAWVRAFVRWWVRMMEESLGLEIAHRLATTSLAGQD